MLRLGAFVCWCGGVCVVCHEVAGGWKELIAFFSHEFSNLVRFAWFHCWGTDGCVRGTDGFVSCVQGGGGR